MIGQGSSRSVRRMKAPRPPGAKKPCLRLTVKLYATPALRRRRRQAQARIARIREAIRAIDLCSGTLLRRAKLCERPQCGCAQDPAARHGPYSEWGHMKGGKLVHRMVSARQAALLRAAIKNYRKVRQLLRAWEAETDRSSSLRPTKPLILRVVTRSANVPRHVRKVGAETLDKGG